MAYSISKRLRKSMGGEITKMFGLNLEEYIALPMVDRQDLIRKYHNSSPELEIADCGIGGLVVIEGPFINSHTYSDSC